MKAFVTGGAGFIGSNLVDGLVGRGDEVTVFDDLSTGRRQNLDGALEAGAELVEGDVRDSAALTAAVERAAPEAVFHLAAQIDVRRSVADPAFDADVNVGGTANLLEASRLAGARRFVFVSTAGVYGDGGGAEPPLDETTPIAPESPYGQSKHAAEGYVALYQRLHGLSGLTLRLANVYGPRQDPLGEGGVIAIFCGRRQAGGRPTVYGDGRQTRDYIYVGDVVTAALAAADSDASGALNVGTGVQTDVLELAAEVGRLGEGDFEPEPAPARPGEILRSALDASRAEAELGWRPQTGLAEGLRLTLDSVSG